jgi:hypothetical protein
MHLLVAVIISVLLGLFSVQFVSFIVDAASLKHGVLFMSLRTLALFFYRL